MIDKKVEYLLNWLLCAFCLAGFFVFFGRLCSWLMLATALLGLPLAPVRRLYAHGLLRGRGGAPLLSPGGRRALILAVLFLAAVFSAPTV